MSGSYDEKKQYYIYDVSSFIADVGGYMGLLLGCSVFGLYIEMENLLAIVKAWLTARLAMQSSKTAKNRENDVEYLSSNSNHVTTVM